MTEKEFGKKFKIRKLIKADVFAGYYLKSVKKHRKIIQKASLENFKLICEFYKIANENNLCVLILVV